MPAPRGPRFEGRTRIEHVQRLIHCQGSYSNAGCDEPGWDAGHCLITAAGSPCASTRRIFRYPARPANCLAVTRRVAGEKHNVIHLLAAEMAQLALGTGRHLCHCLRVLSPRREGRRSGRKSRLYRTVNCREWRGDSDTAQKVFSFW